MVKIREAWCAAVRMITELDTIEWLNNNNRSDLKPVPLFLTLHLTTQLPWCLCLEVLSLLEILWPGSAGSSLTAIPSVVLFPFNRALYRYSIDFPFQHFIELACSFLLSLSFLFLYRFVEFLFCYCHFVVFLKGTEINVFGQSVTFIQKSCSFKSSRVNINII